MLLSKRKQIRRRSRGLTQNWQDAVSSELKKAKRLTILGIGNEQKADDGAGCLCVRLIQKKMGPSPFIQVLDAGETPEKLTGVIRKFNPTHVLIIDAAIGGHKPGTIFIINKRKIRQDDLSTHRIPLSHLVRYLEESVGCRVILLGIEPREISWKKSLSPPVKAALPTLVEVILKIWNRKTGPRTSHLFHPHRSRFPGRRSSRPKIFMKSTPSSQSDLPG